MDGNIKTFNIVLKSIRHFQAGFNLRIQKWSRIRKSIHILTIVSIYIVSEYILTDIKKKTHDHLPGMKTHSVKFNTPYQLKKKFLGRLSGSVR